MNEGRDRSNIASESGLWVGYTALRSEILKRIELRRQLFSIALALIAVISAAAATIVACSPPLQPTSTSTPAGRIVKPGEIGRITAEPATGPTAENPQVILHLIIKDKETGQPVAAAISVDGRTIAIHATEIKVPLPGRIADNPIRLTITAQGYETWESELRWNVNYDRELRVPVELVPIRPPGA